MMIVFEIFIGAVLAYLFYGLTRDTEKLKAENLQLSRRLDDLEDRLDNVR